MKIFFFWAENSSISDKIHESIELCDTQNENSKLCKCQQKSEEGQKNRNDSLMVNKRVKIAVFQPKIPIF
jgi:hypothetical protein